MGVVSIGDKSVVILAASRSVTGLLVGLLVADLAIEVLVIEGKTPSVRVTSFVAIWKVCAVDCHGSDVRSAPELETSEWGLLAEVCNGDKEDGTICE